MVTEVALSWMQYNTRFTSASDRQWLLGMSSSMRGCS